ncbi:MAG: hypothetical protein C0406_07060 [Sideroxydans sp.]|nr:hypothetical protein [Sideroxydans sp.]
MAKLTLIFLLAFTSIAASSAEVNCKKLHASAQSSGIALEASVIGKGRAYFHTAPHAQCKNENVFVVRGDYLTVYNEHRGWLYGMFINKDGDEFSGWVLEKRLQIHGKYGR